MGGESRESSGSVSASVKAGKAAADMTRRMICGGLAGMIAKTATNPLERIKMLSQTGEHGMQKEQQQTILGLYRSILRNEGIIGLWAGNGANLLRVFPAKAVVFSTNDMYRRLFLHLRRSTTNHKADESLPSYLSFLAGGFAGMSASAATYPLDLARARISGKLAGQGKQRHYSGILQCILLTVREEGLFALYKGVTPTLLGAMPYEGIKFATVAIMEKIFPKQQHQDGGGTLTTPWRKMLFGGMGGVMAGLITYPNDTVRRFLQLQGSRGTTEVYTGYWDCVRKIYAKHGIRRFYSGLTINIIRMAPNAAVQFGSYELLKQWTEGLF